MQFIPDVKCMLCPPNCVVRDISGLLHEMPTGFIYNNIKYLTLLPYLTENHTEKLICSLYLAMIHTV